MSLISTLARNMATALQQLCQNHRQNQQVGLLRLSFYSVTVVCAYAFACSYEAHDEPSLLGRSPKWDE
jgi:hypothetical protein